MLKWPDLSIHPMCICNGIICVTSIERVALT